MIGDGFLLNNLVVLAVVYAATALPFTIYLLSGYFATLPHDFEEAAYIDGAGYGQHHGEHHLPHGPALHHHHHPLQLPLLLERVHHLHDPHELGFRPPGPCRSALLNLMQAQQSAAQYGTMYAGLVMVMLPTLILYICVQKKLTQGMTVGGLKG